MARTKKQSSEAAVREIRRRTRRKFSPEEKIRIVLESFRVHPEAKSAGPEGSAPGAEAIGLLRRLDVRVFTVEHIGKETNRLEQQQEGICLGDPQAVYSEPRTRAQLRAQLDQTSISELSLRLGVSERMLRDLRQGTRKGLAKTWRAVAAALVEMLDDDANQSIEIDGR